jgi:hypothetical protein
MMSPEKAQELIRKWEALSKKVDPNDWVNIEYEPIIFEMLPILSELKEAGYTMNDEGQWFHPSEAN